MAKKKTTIVKHITFKATVNSEGVTVVTKKHKGYSVTESLGVLEIFKQELIREAYKNQK